MSAVAQRGPAATLDAVSLRYGPNGVVALRDLSLTLPAGAVTGVVGPSGCGKSTFLYLLSGLITPTSGTVVRKRPPEGVHPLTMVFQRDTLLPWLTTRENVGLFFRFHRHSHAEVRRTVDELLAMVGLEEFGDAYPYQLSGGMRRRVALLAGFAPKPSIMLMDEPFSSLDEPTRVAVHQDVLRIIRQTDMTVVLVTHDLAEAITLCDEILIMSARPGRVVSRHAIPFGRDREVLALRQTPDFLELYGRLWHDLGEQIAKARERTPTVEGRSA